MTALASPTTRARLLPDDLGRFCWDVAGGTAAWSDSVYRLHGYQPGQLRSSSALAFAHKHPEDLYGCVDALHAGSQANRLIVHEHRLVDSHQRVRPVVMIARPVPDPQGQTRQFCGFLLASEASPDIAARSPLAHRDVALIPILMDTFGVSESGAEVVLAARRPLTARRTARQQAFAERYGRNNRGCDLRRIREDTMFPLEHLSPPSVELAA